MPEIEYVDLRSKNTPNWENENRNIRRDERGRGPFDSQES